MIFIRTDANEHIATGHVMRCITIADNLRNMGAAVRFLVSDEASTKLIKAADFEYTVLNSSWENPCNQDEIEKMRDILSKDNDAVLLADSYSISGEYTEKLKAYAKIAVMDDLFEEKFAADLIINYSLYHNLFDYKGRYNDRTRLLLGGAYVPLRAAFSEDVEELRAVRAAQLKEDEVINVLLICGGGDKENALGGITQAVVKAGLNLRCRFHIVAGAYNPNKAFLKQMEADYGGIIVYDGVDDMAGLMKKCDIAVSAASTVLYECCAMQLPTIFFIVADNQKYDRECFSKDNVMLYAGDMRSDREATIKSVADNLEYLINNNETMIDMQRKEKEIVDGKGADRIAKELKALMI